MTTAINLQTFDISIPKNYYLLLVVHSHKDSDSPTSAKLAAFD